MKVKLLFGCLIVIAAVCLLIVSQRRMQIETMTNVEAQAEVEEGIAVFCRCHADGTCQKGNAISFRPSCGTFFTTDPVLYYDCSALEENCP